MKVAVVGLWHLGTVTAACCAAAGHEVVGFDDDKDVVGNLRNGALPVSEPGLCTLVAEGVAAGNLRFTSNPADTSDSEIVWICYDTPVDENDVPDTEFVRSRVSRMISFVKPGALVLISSQLPVGSTAKLQTSHPDFVFAYSPENLRLGKAIEVFTKPDRVVIGVSKPESHAKLSLLFAPFTTQLEWMSVESAEMTKHALNAFLATSVAFINEIASICEKTGADALEVERGLKSDVRIGTKSYLHPGCAFAGGTLARDIRALLSVAEQRQVPTHLLSGVLASNSIHSLWAQHRLLEILGNLEGKTVAVLGLTYKPGTNTLRRSMSVEICHWLIKNGARVQAFDPAIRELPTDLKTIHLATEPELVLDQADAVLVATPWPEFRSLPAAAFRQRMCRAVVLDPTRQLDSILKNERAVEYHAIGIVS